MKSLESLGKLINQNEKEINESNIEKEITLDSIYQMIEKKGEKSEDFVSGLVFVLNKRFSNYWESSDNEGKEKLKHLLIQVSELQLKQRESMIVINLTIDLFKKLSFEWPELIDFVLSPIASVHKATLFLKVFTAWEHFFEEPRLEAIYKSINQFMAFDDPKTQMSMLITINNMDPIPLFEQEHTLFESMWGALLNISKNLRERVTTAALVSAELFKSAPVLRELESTYLTRFITNADTFDNIQLVLPYIHLLNDDSMLLLLAKVVDYIKTIENDTDKVIKFVNFMCHLQLELILEDSLSCVYTVVDDVLPETSGLILFAPFAPFISDYYDRDEYMEIIRAMMKSESDFQVMLGIKTLLNIADNAEFFSIELKSSVLIDLVNLLPNPDVFTVIEKLIKANLFDHEKALQALENSYVKTEKSEKIFDLLKLFLDTTLAKDLSVDSIFDFAYITLRNSTNLHEIGNCISLLNGTAKQKCSAFDACVEDYITYDTQLIDKNESIEYAIENIALSLKIAPELYTDMCKERINQFIDFAAKLPGVIPSVSLILILLKDEKLDSVFKLIPLLKGNEDVYHDVLNKTAKNTKNCDPRFAEKLAQLIVERSMTLSSFDLLNEMLNSLNKLMKRFKINKSIVEGLFEQFVKIQHPVFRNRGLASFADNKTRILAFLTSYERSYPESKNEVASVIAHWFNLSPFSMMTPFTDAVTELAIDGSLGDKSHQFYDILFSNLSEEETITDARILRTIVTLIKADSTVCDVNLFNAHLLNLWESSKSLNGLWRSSLGSSILELCAIGADAYTDDIEEVLAEFPFSPGFCICDNACRSLCKIVQMDKYDDLSAAAAKSISDVLIMRSTKLFKYGISCETLSEMRNVLFKIMDGFEVIITELMKIYKEQSEYDLSQFEDLVEQYKAYKVQKQ